MYWNNTTTDVQSESAWRCGASYWKTYEPINATISRAGESTNETTECRPTRTLRPRRVHYNFSDGLDPYFACDAVVKQHNRSTTSRFEFSGEPWEVTLYYQDSGIVNLG
jgi:hypothetical protein